MKQSLNNEAQYRRSEAQKICYHAGIALAAVPFVQRMLDAEALVKTLVERVEALEQATKK
jgi:hypothetical protein